MIFHFARTPRSRWAFGALTLPYVLAAIFVHFVHAGPPPRAAVTTIVAGEVSVVAAPVPRPDDGCAACLWLQVGVRLSAPALGHSPTLVSTETYSPFTRRPDSLVQHPTAPRGPPASSLS